MRNLAVLALVQLTLSPSGLLCIITATKEFGKKHWRIHKCSSAAAPALYMIGRKLIFASLSIHIVKKSDCCPERANLYATAMITYHSISKRLE